MPQSNTQIHNGNHVTFINLEREREKKKEKRERAASVGRYTEQSSEGSMHTTEMKMLRWIRGLLRLILWSTFEPVSEPMVKHVIMTSAPKTCSLDPIPTPLLLELLDCLLSSPTALINSSIRSGLFHQVFKQKSCHVFSSQKLVSILTN